MKNPSVEDALLILQKEKCSKKVIDHCIAVSKLAKEIAEKCKRKGLDVDVDLVEIGALLHDLGRAKTHGIRHSIVGGEMARALRLPESIVSIIERHVGGGISRKEAKALGFPEKSYIPQTSEEKIVSYADKLIEGNKRVNMEETIRKFARELGSDHPTIERLRNLQVFFKDILRD